jgi:AcrR family transcriptional regulator
MDRRVLKTKKAIRAAFLTLMIEKRDEKITVKDIADKADVDRKTIYNYYRGVEEILGEIENELIAHFETAMNSLAGEYDPKAYFLMLAQLIENDMELYELLMRSGHSSFVTKAVIVLNEWLHKALNKTRNLDTEKVTTAAEYIAAGIFFSYSQWFASSRTKTLKEFSIELYELVIHGLPTYLLK